MKRNIVRTFAAALALAAAASGSAQDISTGPAVSVDPFRPSPLLEKRSYIKNLTQLAHHFAGEERGSKMQMMALGDRRYLVQADWVIDVSDPIKPEVVTKGRWRGTQLQLAYNDRAGKWVLVVSDGGGRPQPGAAKPNRGVSVFDLSDPRDPRITAYFVPEQGGEHTRWEPLSGPMTESNRTVDNVFIEWDRRLIWVASDSGLYVLSSPVLGKPVLTPAPVREWTLPSINRGWDRFRGG